MNSFASANIKSVEQVNEGGCRDDRSAKMIETRHGLESNPVPTSIFAPKRAMVGSKWM